MMKPEDFPEFRAALEKYRALISEQQQKNERKATIQSQAKNASRALRIASFSDWQDEFVALERGEPLLDERIKEAKSELDRVRGQVSLAICQQARPAFVAQAKIILRSLRALCDANNEIVRLGGVLEQTGVETGSIANCVFTMDRWSDQHGGRVTGYQTWIREHFPELKNATY